MTEFGYASQVKIENFEIPLDKEKNKEIHKAMLEAIIKDSRPFNDFCKEGMSGLLEKVVKGFKPRDRKTNSRHFKKEYKNHQRNLIKLFKMIDDVALTTDLWKNKGLEHFIVLTAHFFDQQFNYVSIVVSFEKFIGRHFANRIKPFLLREIKKLGLKEKIISITTDNGADIKSATSNGFGTRFSCLAHNLNLVAKSIVSFKKE